MAGDVIFFSLAGPVGDYTGAHSVIFAGFFYKSHSGKIYAPGSPSSGLNPILHTWIGDSCFTCDGS